MKLSLTQHDRQSVPLTFSWHALDKCYGRIGKDHQILVQDLRTHLNNIEKCIHHTECYRVKGLHAIYILAKGMVVITILKKDKSDREHFRKHVYRPLGKHKSQLLWSFNWVSKTEPKKAKRKEKIMNPYFACLSTIN